MDRVFIEPVNVAAYYLASKDDILIQLENSNLTHGDASDLGSTLCFTFKRVIGNMGLYICSFSTYYFSTHDLDEINEALSELLQKPVVCHARLLEKNSIHKPALIFSGSWTIELFLSTSQLESK